jgi:hypothetical protein
MLVKEWNFIDRGNRILWAWQSRRRDCLDSSISKQRFKYLSFKMARRLAQNPS